MIKRVILIVLDSLGVGALPDARRFGDEGANTLLHIHQAVGGLSLPNLCALGLGRLAGINCSGVQIKGSYGRMAESSAAKDTTTGHWELAGIISRNPAPTYPQGFPPQVIRAFEKAIGRGVLGNCASSGTVILNKLGAEHLDSGKPIVYTSADSVFQIAVHEDIMALDELYRICRAARDILIGPHAVSRVIARPFRGRPGSFFRNNPGRKDFSLPPPKGNLLEILQENGLFTVGVGKIGDIFAHRGLSQETHTESNRDGVEKTLAAMAEERKDRGLIMVNLVDFDMVYGHRRDPEGYAKALMEFDAALPRITGAMQPDDLLMITADHGCDPTHKGHTDHTREYAPLLVYGEGVRPGIDLGTRQSFADCGRSAADFLGVYGIAEGVSFKEELLL